MARMWHAAREVISSVGHPLGYPGFSEAARVCPQGPIEASPCSSDADAARMAVGGQPRYAFPAFCS